ncbi:hypothetical protein [Pedobacter xixiisoli]|uniref:Uncharacterized protein n=1 Tax=Pedobacter xixiisoli TaxID=1476464 RepID=A0A285ZR07_9SPHI|nr:hypothetical protein [Pedobacter xixiisoli]SOD12050.1 hypothetical protein SAMN06297358_0468 [Pedobacter xixiisoli]
MRVNIKTENRAMERLEPILKETFAGLNYLNVSEDSEYFYMEFASATKDMAKVMRELDGLVKPYIHKYGDENTAYVFHIYKGKELVNIIRYHEKHYGYRVAVKTDGEVQQLFVVDLLGIGDYSVFNQHFEQLGLMYRPVRTPAIGQYRMDLPTSFSDAGYWATSSKVLKPYLEKIVKGIAAQLNRDTGA